MTQFPFPITTEIVDAYQAHVDYISAGQHWLLKNDPDAYTELVLIETIQTTIERAAEKYFRDDEDALEEFLQEFEIQDTTGGVWYDVIEQLVDKEAETE